MDPEIKAKWLEALRSGEYKQGQGGLRDEGDNYCCLGVLCQVVIPDSWVPFRGSSDTDLGWYAVEGDPGFPPVPLCEEIELPWDEVTAVADMNDAGKTFEQIADYIEDYL